MVVEEAGVDESKKIGWTTNTVLSKPIDPSPALGEKLHRRKNRGKLIVEALEKLAMDSYVAWRRFRLLQFDQSSYSQYTLTTSTMGGLDS